MVFMGGGELFLELHEPGAEYIEEAVVITCVEQDQILHYSMN
jgi:hypothetical protein